jgi:hypothetical protein
MNEEDEAFNDIERQAKQRKESVRAAISKVTDPCEKHCEATAFKIVIKNLEHEVAKIKAERDEIYGLLGSAHLELRQNLEYGYNRNTIKSTLISVGQYAPKLRAKMDELQAKMGDKEMKK